MRRILSSYLSERAVNATNADGSITIFKVSCGVPQGSVQGPDLWNVLYDELLRIRLPTDFEFIAFAGITLVATASVSFLLEEALGTDVAWMESMDRELALEKTEAIVLTNRNVRNTMTVKFGVHSFQSKRSVKYLGVQVDFAEHVVLASKRASDAGRQLERILLNLRV